MCDAAGKSATADYISKLEVLACYYLASVYSLVTGIPAVYCLIMVRCGQGGSKSCRKDNARLVRNELNVFVLPSSKSKSSHTWREVKNRSTVGG